MTVAPITAEELYLLLEARGAEASLPSVYRILRQLEQGGLTVRSDTGPARRKPAAYMIEQAQTAERIYLSLIKAGVGISLGSVYRILTEFEQYGLVHRVWSPHETGTKSRFMLVSSEPALASCAFVCPICHTRHEITDKALVDSIRRQAYSAGFEPGLKAATINLICQQCAADGQ